MTVQETFSGLSVKELVEMSDGLFDSVVPEDSKLRLIASQVFMIPVSQVNLLQIMSLGALIAQEFSRRIKNMTL